MINHQEKSEYSELAEKIDHKLKIVHKSPFYVELIPREMSAKELIKEGLGATQMSHEVEGYYYILFRDLDDKATLSKVKQFINKEEVDIEDTIPFVLKEAMKELESNYINSKIEGKKLKIIGHVPREIPSLDKPFVARLNFPDREPPLRAYLHKAGLFEAYGKIDPVKEAINYITGVLDQNKKELVKYDFILAAMWGLKKPDKAKLIDFFGLSDISKRWPGNPDISAWVVKNGVYIPQKEITCGDTLIVLGREEEHRRTKKSLDDYVKTWPNLKGLEPRISKTIS